MLILKYNSFLDNMKKILVLSFLLLLLLSGCSNIYKLPNSIAPVKNVENSKPVLLLDASKVLPKDMKIISSEATTYILEGEHKGIKFKVGINLVLRPDGQCIKEDSYYNSKTKTGGAGFYSISLSDHKSGNFQLYYCDPAIIIDGFSIPNISGEIQDLYGEPSQPSIIDHYSAEQALLGAMSTIKNNFYNQIYFAQNPKYSSEELDKYGKVLEKIFTHKCLMPKYNNQSLLNTGPNAGGCSPIFWQNDNQNYNIKKGFLSLLTAPGCKENYVGNYLLDLSLNTDLFKEDKFIKDLSCAGKITIEKGYNTPY